MLHILVITLALQVLGFIWYSNALFGPAWRRVMGSDGSQSGTQPSAKKNMALISAANFLLLLATVTVLAWAIAGETSVVIGMKLSFVIWFGFILPIVGMQALWSGKPKTIAQEMFLVFSGYYLVAMLVAGALIVIW